MMKDLTPWGLALALVLSACGDDDDAVGRSDDEECGKGSLCDDREDAGRKPDASVGAKDASLRDASDVPQGEKEVDASRPRDAAVQDATTARDAASDAAAPAGDGSLESLRQACLDTINMYRATKSLPPMMRANATSEACSDDGAAFDSKANKAHGSAAKGAVPCRTQAVAQNTCPNWTVRKGGTVEDSLKQCLKQMWEEGEPPGGVKACTDAYFAGDTACFLAHGHYINMISDNKFVSCGFYVNDKQQWWMNQDFTSR